MSNVLIGIIGVILFIGLALAGALFLGPRFQESSNASSAAAYVQALSQVSSALSMYHVNEGVSFGDGDVEGLVSKGYLKAMPEVGSGAAVVLGNEPGGVATMRVSYDDPVRAKSICEAINLQTTGSKAIQEAPTSADAAVGCYSLSGPGNAKYFAYANRKGS